MRVRAEMPGEDTPPPRARGWVLGVAGLVYLVARAAYDIIVQSGIPNGYKGRHWNERDFVHGEWPYPSDDVRTFLIILGVDALFAIWLLSRRSKSSLTARSAALAALHFFGMALMFPLMMHTSEPIPTMFVYLLFSTGWLVLFAFLAAILARPRKPS